MVGVGVLVGVSVGLRVAVAVAVGVEVTVGVGVSVARKDNSGSPGPISQKMRAAAPTTSKPAATPSMMGAFCACFCACGIFQLRLGPIFIFVGHHPFTRRVGPEVAALRSPREALMVFLTSVIIWLLETVKYWFVMHAFAFEASFFTLMLMNGVVNLATTIPAAPGYLGTFDAPGIAVLVAKAE